MSTPHNGHLQAVVSVVMPAHNAARTLTEAINSVLAQSYNNLELIICNDASSDGTSDILSSIADPRVKVVHNETNLGEGLARDRAMQQASGAWIAVIDADDAWHPDRLAVLMQGANPSENIMIFDDILECHDTSSGMVPWRALRGKHAFDGNGADAVSVPVRDFVVSDRLLIKPLIPARLIHERVAHTNLKFGADTEFFLRLMAAGARLRYVPRAMYHYRITPGSASGYVDRLTMMREILENAVLQFEHAVDVQDALRGKIDAVRRDEAYMPFVWALGKKQMLQAFRLAWRSPWIIPEFLRRSARSLIYNLHRLWHGGRGRGIR